jgi:hypothetical protein
MIDANGPSPEEEVALVELVDRLLDKGVVLCGDVTLSVVDVDFVYVGLRVLLSSAEKAERWRLGIDASTRIDDSTVRDQA